MMTGPHPHDLELLDYVEDELTSERRRAVGAHVDSCATCEATVGELEAARAALHAVPTLELPLDGQERIRAAVAAADAERRARRSPLRLAALLAPVAVLAALVVGVVTMADLGGDDAGVRGDVAARQVDGEAQSGAAEGGGADDPNAGEGELAEPAPQSAEPAPSGGGGESAGGASTSAPLSAAGPVASVEGPAEEVASALRERGFDARADDGRVVVRNARPRAVVHALAEQPRGPVAVEVE